MSDRLQPALWGGLFIGVLSALPLVSVGNCCCCLWVFVGGALSAYLRQQNNPYQIDAAEGAIVGLMAGALGGVVYAILSIPIEMFTGPMQARWMESLLSSNPDVPPEMRDAVETRPAAAGAPSRDWSAPSCQSSYSRCSVSSEVSSAWPSSRGTCRRLRRPGRSTSRRLPCRHPRRLRLSRFSAADCRARPVGVSSTAAALQFFVFRPEISFSNSVQPPEAPGIRYRWTAPLRAIEVIRVPVDP